MGPWGDERGQSTQVGAVLLFGFLVVSMATYQSAVVPAQNEAVEFQHSQQVQGDLEAVRNAVLTAANTGESRPVAVPLGTRYSPRTFFVNPPPASGTIRTEGSGDESLNVTVDGVTAPGEAGDFWNGSARSYDTGFVAYEPSYARYEAPPTTRYENTVLSNEFPNGHRAALSGQMLVDGRRVHLVVLDGSLRESGVGPYSVTPRPLSVSTNAVTVTNGSGVTITFPTRLDEETWTELVDGEFASVSVEPGDPYDTVTVSLTDATYELRLSRVGVGRVADADEPPAYLTVVDPLARGLTTGRSDTVTLEVRDRYNNPVSGVAVTANSSSTLAVTAPLGSRSDADGRVSYTVTPTAAGNASASFSIGEEAWETVAYDDRRVSDGGGAESGDGTGTGDGGNTTGTPTSLTYPSDYRDQNGGPAIPPENPTGTLSAFSDMQADNGQKAQFNTQWNSSQRLHRIGVGVETAGVRSASAYGFEVKYYTGYAAAVDLVDGSGTVLQSEALPAVESGTGTVNVTLNRAASEAVRSDGTLYAVYRYRGEYQTTLYVSYQRVHTYD